MTKFLTALVLLSRLASHAAASSSNQTIHTSSSACNTTRASDVIEDIRLNNLNVTILVATCRGVCNIVLGSGNPDMAGKGVMISYYFQVALTILFGPVLPFIIRISKKRSFQSILQRVPLLEKLLLSVVQTSLFYSSSLYIAAVVRYCQSPSISESIILGPLLNLQLTTVSYLLCGLVLEWRLGDFRIPLEWLLCSLAIVLLQGLVCIVLQVNFPPARKEDLKYYYSLARPCKAQGNFTGTVFHLTRYSHGVSLEGTGLLISLPAVWLIMYLIPKGWKRLPESVIRWIHWKELKVGLSAVVLAFLSLLLIGCIKLLVDVSGADVQENSWGYGQTTAVLLWAPFLFEATIETIKHERKLRAARQPEIELQESKKPDQTQLLLARNVSTSNEQAPNQPSESSESGDQLTLQDPDDEAEDDDILSGLNRRDTEARIEGSGSVGQGAAERAATWQYERLQDPPAAHRLRRRFT